MSSEAPNFRGGFRNGPRGGFRGGRGYNQVEQAGGFRGGFRGRRGGFRGGRGGFRGGSRGGFRGGFRGRRGGFRGRRGGFRGRGRGRGRRGRGGRRGPRRDEWNPLTKLGRLVKARKITSIHQIFLHSMAIREHQIVDQLIPNLKDEVMSVKPVQKQTPAGQRTRFKAVVVVGDGNGHCGVGIKVAAEVASAIRDAIIRAKISIVPVRTGWWGNKIGAPHTIPAKVTGKCGSIKLHLIPAPRGTGLVCSPIPKKLLTLAGVQDVFSRTDGHTKTLPNFVKATYYALSKTYSFLSVDFWEKTQYNSKDMQSLFQQHSDFLKNTEEKKKKTENEEQK